MPSLITHYEFSYQYFKGYSKVFYVASQGPDPFFHNGYTNLFASKKKKKQIKNIRDFGTYLHEIDPYLYLGNLLIEISEIKNEKERLFLLDFIKGLTSHYILDSIAHPYIFYITGFSSFDPIYTFYHMYSETCIDVLIMDYFKHYPSYKDILKLNKNERMIISKLFYKLAKKLDYKGINKDDYAHSLKTMLTDNLIINSKVFGLRKAFFNKFMKFSFINSMSHPKLKNVPKEDLLNLKKNNYYNVVTNELIGNYNFFELMENAKNKLNEAIKIIDDIILNKNSKSYVKFNELLNNINHSGIHPNDKMKYMNVIVNKSSF